MLYAPGDVSPGPVLLALRHIVPAPGADHGAGVPHVGLGAVAGEAGAGHSCGGVGVIVVIIVGGDLLAPPGWGPSNNID